MRRGLASGLLALGFFLVHTPAATAQTAPPPTSSSTTAPASSGATATTRPVSTQRSGAGITAGGEGFPWIPVGIGILVAGLIGSRLRRLSRR